jgi:mRNA interferase MazF
VKRGEVYLATLHPRSGSEQRGRRPAIVLSHDAFNTAPGWRSVIVVPVSTSAKQRRRGPTAVEIERGDGGLEEDSVALCHQVTTLDRAKLERCLGDLRPETMARVEFGLAAALDLPGQALT